MKAAKQSHVIPGTSILVDHFYRPQSQAGFHYILTHFHGDHYSRLSEAWDAPVHCSPLTARLAVAVLGVREDLLRPHAVGESFELGGATVRFLDAHHCPGAVMVLAKPLDGGVQHMHTGDFRATAALLKSIEELECRKVHTLMLDSTYALAKRSFPAQEDVIEKVVADLAGASSSALILIAAYSLGKERVILRAAEHLDCSIFAGSEKKSSIYSTLDLSSAERSRFVADPSKARIHVVPFNFCGEIWPFFQPNFKKCEEMLSDFPAFDSIVGVLPTGHADASNWNRRHEVVSKGRVTLRLYAYSEHSSAQELASFITLLRPVKLVPTVFRDAKEQQAIIRKFQSMLDQAGAVRQLFSGKAPALGATEASGACADTESVDKPSGGSENSSALVEIAAAEAEKEKLVPHAQEQDMCSAAGLWRGKRLREAVVPSPLSGPTVIMLDSDDEGDKMQAKGLPKSSSTSAAMPPAEALWDLTETSSLEAEKPRKQAKQASLTGFFQARASSS